MKWEECKLPTKATIGGYETYIERCAFERLRYLVLALRRMRVAYPYMKTRYEGTYTYLLIE